MLHPHLINLFSIVFIVILPNRPVDKRAVCERRKYFANDTFSDHMVLLRVFQVIFAILSCKK